VLVRAGSVVGSLFYRRVLFVALDLAQPIPDVEVAVPVRIALLEGSDAEAYARFRGRQVEVGSVRRRLEEGGVCVVAWLDDEIVSAAWLAFETAWIEKVDRELRLAPDEVYGYDSYTSESERNLGIAAFRSRWTMRYLRDLGYRRTVAWVTPENRPALGPLRKVGYTALGWAGYVRVGPWRRDFVQPVGGRRRWEPPHEPLEVRRDLLSGGDTAVERDPVQGRPAA
jgi:hypothetical protein